MHVQIEILISEEEKKMKHYLFKIFVHEHLL